MVAEIFSYGHVVKEILFDNEAVFNAARDYVRERGIQPFYTPSGLHNNLSERYTQTLKRKVLALEASLSYEVPDFLKLETMMAAKRSCNKTPGFKSGVNHTPHSLMTNRKPRLDRFKYGDIGLAYTARLDTPGVVAEWSMMIEEFSTGNFKVYIPSRQRTFSVVKFEPTGTLPVEWGWKHRVTLVDNDIMKKITGEMSRMSVTHDRKREEEDGDFEKRNTTISLNQSSNTEKLVMEETLRPEENNEVESRRVEN